MMTRDELIKNYNLLAPIYAERFCNELDGKPFDRNLLKRFVEAVPGGRICDLGCGPGHVAAHLATLGADAVGVDLTPNMIAEARRRFPSIDYQVGDMLDLQMEAESLGGIVALYSIIHLERDKLPKALSEVERVLQPGGPLLVSFHRGEGVLQEDEVLETEASFDCTLFEPDEVVRAMEDAGLSVAETTVRRPYDFEYPSQRVYVLADKPVS